jgi:hypothetical protein
MILIIRTPGESFWTISAPKRTHVIRGVPRTPGIVQCTSSSAPPACIGSYCRCRLPEHVVGWIDDEADMFDVQGAASLPEESKRSGSEVSCRTSA